MSTLLQDIRYGVRIMAKRPWPSVVAILALAIGFGCLAFAHHRGLRSLGFVMALGCAACLAASLLFLPPLLALLKDRLGGSQRST